MELKNTKIAIICDWIIDMGGAERVLGSLLSIFPHADIYTSVFFQKENPLFHGKKVYTSFIQNIPFLRKSHKLSLMLRPLAFESFDLSLYDIVISTSSAESKGVITKPHTLHICYCHTPTRYFWSHYHEYLHMMEFGFLNFLAKALMPFYIHGLREWDFVASQRPDFFIANSINTKKRISRYYHRNSDVIYPCIDIHTFPLCEQKKDYYFYAGRCVPYKKFELIVNTFNQNKKSLIIATNTDNALYKQLKKRSNTNIQWILSPSDILIKTFYAEAKAFLFPPEEDFGLVPLEAMACGTPVIAYKKGGALETVEEGLSGTFFEEQNIMSINNAIEKFEKMHFDAKKIRAHAEKWDYKVFHKKIQNYIQERYTGYPKYSHG